ncbi:hypothetical protein [Bacteroides sp. An51A]|uniref:PL29 family lyase N-terminal domain-containing protein n=1 Tax=Bacteroides sp. An51A TaxID=1965640 RepID=UPI000B39EC06|nr:hypothetical protein [Bacteroides sp. An51A]OUN81567.1 hypothetical protein B5G04_04650 [Bacteroides sp. An51A]
MRKKYLSALLFGALLFASAGTFTSCKDYDDDINNLQQQITSNKDAIAALQKLVGEGKWVSSVTPIENGFTVTMNDGTTQNITGINGEDGKPGTVITLDPTTNNWIIDGVDTGVCAKGEKGEQGEQGEQGEAGEPGKSPYIDKETGNWFVWEWDEATSEYKAVDSGVYAGSTQIYVVEKEGFIELNVDGTAYLLPTTSDAYTVEAPADQVKVVFETADWTKWNSNNADAKTLLKKFPELAEIKKDAVVKQGGKLPLIVTPASIELDDQYTYSLVNLKGETAEITVSSPVKGLPEGLKWDGDKLESRSADASSCLWTLNVEPAFDEKKEEYKSTDGRSSLLVENSKGTVVRTAYAYTVESADIDDDVDVIPDNTSSFKYAETIDVLEAQEDGKVMFKLKNEYKGYVVLEATNAVQVEKYGITIDGTKVTIANMPVNETQIDVTLKLTAAGLNGSVKSSEKTFSITQGVESVGMLADRAVTLNVDPTKATIRWNLEDLKFSPVQLDNFFSGDVTLTATREKDDKKYVAYNGPITWYNANGQETIYKSQTATWSNGTAVTFGINVNGAVRGAALDGHIREQFTATEYELTLTSMKGTSVIYSDDATLTVSNPDAADILRLNPAFVEDGVLQVSAVPTGNNVAYDFESGIIKANAYTTALGVPTFTDMDYKTFVDNGGDINSNDFANWNWIENDELHVNTWKEGSNVPANEQHMYKVRKIRAQYPLFNNPNNKITFDFEVVVKSQVYSDDPTKVITFDNDKLVAVYGGADGSNKVDIKNAVKSAVFALGSDKGKSYTLFATKAEKIKATGYAYGNTVGLTTPITEENEPNEPVNYMLDVNNMLIELAVKDMNYLGYSGDKILAAQTGEKKFYLTEADYLKLWDSVKGQDYFKNEGIYYALKDAAAANKDANYTRFIAYATQIKFQEQKDIVVGSTTDKLADNRIVSVAIKAVDKNYAAKFIENINDFGGNLNLNAFKGNSVITVKDQLEEGVSETSTVDMQLIVKDVWNKTMYVPFKLTVKTTK